MSSGTRYWNILQYTVTSLLWAAIAVNEASSENLSRFSAASVRNRLSCHKIARKLDRRMAAPLTKPIPRKLTRQAMKCARKNAAGFSEILINSHESRGGGEAARGAACTFDLTADGVLNSDDFVRFLALFGAGDSRVDFTSNGHVDSDDFILFLSALASGESGCSQDGPPLPPSSTSIVEIDNSKSGISLLLQGENGKDFAPENLYSDSEIGEQVIYIKSSTMLRLENNELNTLSWLHSPFGDTPIGINGPDGIPDGEMIPPGAVSFCMQGSEVSGDCLARVSSYYPEAGLPRASLSVGTPSRDAGIIRYKFGQARHASLYVGDQIKCEGNAARLPNKRYSGAIDLRTERYPGFSQACGLDLSPYFPALPILGTIGSNNGRWGETPWRTTERRYYGARDDFGNLWVSLTTWHDDTEVYPALHPFLAAYPPAEMWGGASDGHTRWLVIDPVTPVLQLKAGPGTEFFSSTPTAYNNPRIADTVSYVTSGVQFNFVSLENEPVLVRVREHGAQFFHFDGEPLTTQELFGTSGVNVPFTLDYKSGENGVLATRKVIVNPHFPASHPRSQTLLWNSSGERNEIVQRIKNTDPFKKGFQDYFKSEWNQKTAPQKYRSQGRHRRMTDAALVAGRNAFLWAVEKSPAHRQYASWAKERLLDASRFQPVGMEVGGLNAFPSMHYLPEGQHFINYESLALAYSLLDSEYRSTDGYSDGITAIEARQIEQGLAKIAYSASSVLPLYQGKENTHFQHLFREPITRIAFAMPHFNSEVLGASGGDLGANGLIECDPTKYECTPYPAQNLSWYEIANDLTLPINPYPAFGVFDDTETGYADGWWNGSNGLAGLGVRSGQEVQVYHGISRFCGVKQMMYGGFDLLPMNGYENPHAAALWQGIIIKRMRGESRSNSRLEKYVSNYLTNGIIRLSWKDPLRSYIRSESEATPFAASISAFHPLSPGIEEQSTQTLLGNFIRDIQRYEDYQCYHPYKLVAQCNTTECLSCVSDAQGVWCLPKQPASCGYISQGYSCQGAWGECRLECKESTHSIFCPMSEERVRAVSDVSSLWGSPYTFAFGHHPDELTEIGDHAEHAPIIKPLFKHVAMPGESLSKEVVAFDPDGDEIRIDVTGLPNGASWDPEARRISWTVPSGHADGFYPMKIRATDLIHGTYAELPFLVVVHRHARAELHGEAPDSTVRDLAALSAAFDSSSDEVVLSWDRASDHAAYVVYRDELPIAIIPATAQPEYRDSGFSRGEPTYYSVTALSSKGRESCAATIGPLRNP